LLDFGLARLADVEGASQTGAAVVGRIETLTQEGTIIGTVQYMAPEQLEACDTDARTDIFAFGSVMYEMLTGRPAFTGATKASVMAAILERDPPAMSAPRDASSVAAAPNGRNAGSPRRISARRCAWLLTTVAHTRSCERDRRSGRRYGSPFSPAPRSSH
jgi:serine/threonine protein kinase